MRNVLRDGNLITDENRFYLKKNSLTQPGSKKFTGWEKPDSEG